jgi:hypothetical protein
VTRRALLNWAGQGLLAATGLALVGSTLLSTDAEAGEGRHPKPTKTPKPSKRTPTATPTMTPTTVPTATPTPTQTQPGPAPFNAANYVGQGDRYGCNDFWSQADAQAVLRYDPTDPNKLDPNRDGIACGGVEAANDGVPGGFMPWPYDTTPVSRP